MTNLTVREVLRHIQGPEFSIDHLDSQLLLGHVLNKSRTWLVAHDDELVPSQNFCDLLDLATKRSSGNPLAYLLGKQEFWSMELKVDPSTLIPRPETECLVETIINEHPNHGCTVLDLGTGSGAIALALASEFPNDNVIAMDKSRDAIQVARYNKQRHKLENISFYLGDWSSAVSEHSVDILVSNPPYIAKDDEHLQNLEYEPITALASGIKGLDDIHQIAADARRLLKPKGMIAVEHGFDQQSEVLKVFEGNGFLNVRGHTDLAGMPRFITANAP